MSGLVVVPDRGGQGENALQDPGRVVEDAWKWLLSEVAEGNVDDGMRAALLARVAQGLESRTKPTGTQQPKQPGTFVAAGDRWAGWWDQPPPDWPHGAVPQPEHVFSALRRLPVDLRALLILRDVGDVSAEDAAAIVPGARHQQQTALEQARDGYLVELDRVMVGSGDDRHQSDM